MTDRNTKVIQNIKDCGQSLIDNAEKIATEYKYRLCGMTITCHVNEDDKMPYIEVNTPFVPEKFIERVNKYD
jgi:hypothetical protein